MRENHAISSDNIYIYIYIYIKRERDKQILGTERSVERYTPSLQSDWLIEWEREKEKEIYRERGRENVWEWEKSCAIFTPFTKWLI